MKTPEEILELYLMRFSGSTEGLIYVSPSDALLAMRQYADQFKNPPKKTIAERFLKFHDECNYFVGEYTHEMVVEFVAYWTEHSEGAKKMRFEKEKVFDIKKRLERWKRNQKPNYAKSERPDTEQALRDWISK